MSYPKTLKLFKAWAKAMEEGATVDRPRYSRTSKSSTATSGRATGQQRTARRVRKRRKRAKKTQD